MKRCIFIAEVEKAAVLDIRNGWLLNRVPRAVKTGRRLDRAIETCSKYHLGITRHGDL